MATQIKKIQTLTVPLDAKPGALAKVYGAFQEAGVNILASWAYEMGPGQAQAHFYAENTTKAKDCLTKLGKKTTLDDAVFAEGDDRVGVYAEILGKAAKANVNLSATDAFAVKGRFATVLFAEDTAALCKVLGC